MKITRIKNKSILGPLAFCLLLGFIVVASMALPPKNSAHAAPVIGFNPGRIMDDLVFTNSSAMNTGQIQAFLDKKVPVCETWHAAGYGQNPPFTCLKDYVENNKSAAQIIYDTAQQYRINPQVFIVLLQKEQGLVTDTWPLASQYRTATGYGCPDTAPCDSQYYGLTNQLQWSGKMFRAIMDGTPNWYTPYVLGNNFIRYSPTVSCGGSNVNIENRATQALYNYTPYQPTQAALAAGYGQAPPCGAYGNRNFFQYFSDWFGNTRYVFGNIPSNTSLYARSACTIPVLNANEVGRLYNPDTRDFLYTMSHKEACLAVSYGYIWDGVVMKSATGQEAIPVYRISNAERHIYTSAPEVRNSYLNNFGYKDEGIGFYVYPSSSQGRIPVYGLQREDTFFITSSGREAVSYQSDYGFHNFGAMYYTDNLNSQPTPVYRITRNHSRLYTTSLLERNNALTHYGFSAEGSVSLNDLSPNEANLPVYRLRDAVNGGYVYTSNRTERDYAVINYNHVSEGAAFYALLWSNAPVYRATNYQNLMRIYTSSANEYYNASNMYRYLLEGVSWYGY